MMDDKSVLRINIVCGLQVNSVMVCFDNHAAMNANDFYSISVRYTFFKGARQQRLD